MILIFVDTNIPIYAAGRPHHLKEPCARILELIAQYSNAFATDAEVMQDLLHRYLSLKLWPEPGLRVIEHFAMLMHGRIEAVGAADVLHAARSANAYPRLSARDLLHLAVALRLGADAIVTADRDFQGLSGIERLDPATVAMWQSRVTSRSGDSS